MNKYNFPTSAHYPERIKIYADLYRKRRYSLKIKNFRNNKMTYGKSNAPESFMYDTLYTYKTTIAGQIFICMWLERMVEVCPQLSIIQVNTDGITLLVPKTSVEKLRNVCDELEKETGLGYEENLYNSMIIRDVNNYIAEYSDNSLEKEHLKLKGCFEIDKECYKDPSMKIVPIALKEYFINGVPIETTICNHKNIYDFCIRLKINRDSKAVYKNLENGQIKEVNLGRTTRYFASKNGGSLTVYYNGSQSMTQLNKGYQFTLFNNYYKSDDYNIDYNFYIKEANKIKNIIEDQQLSLF